jgi:hypothetical protein
MDTAMLLLLLDEQGVEVQVKDDGQLKIRGPQQAVHRLLPQIEARKKEIVELLGLGGGTRDHPCIPQVCRECARLEVLYFSGGPAAGCVTTLPDGSFSEQWKRLPARLARCILGESNS